MERISSQLRMERISSQAEIKKRSLAIPTNTKINAALVLLASKTQQRWGTGSQKKSTLPVQSLQKYIQKQLVDRKRDCPLLSIHNANPEGATTQNSLVFNYHSFINIELKYSRLYSIQNPVQYINKRKKESRKYL